ncbi:HalOD1 output domain-containing protein [Halovivax sp.]|uniref:HalOD1 output domain-containing protein n=1 Tax=Halovivax sp. TaxID=1935978 RepID=UPI0025BAA8DA|nr:HalOD1 output domain-containing protein [Halovivax sp.]
MPAHASGPATLLRAQFDPAEPAEPMETIVECLSHATGVSPLELAPLYESLDPDALSRLVAHADEKTDGESLSIEFRSNGFGVAVSGDGELRIVALD